MTPIIAIGIGCRKNCSAETIAALARRALELAHARPPSPAEREKVGAPGLFTSQAKASEPGVAEAAALLDMELVGLSHAELMAAAPRCATHSARVEAITGLPSLAETAALAGAGPNSRLVLKRISENGASCAIAQGPETKP